MAYLVDLSVCSSINFSHASGLACFRSPAVQVLRQRLTLPDRFKCTLSACRADRGSFANSGHSSQRSSQRICVLERGVAEAVVSSEGGETATLPRVPAEVFDIGVWNEVDSICAEEWLRKSGLAELRTQQTFENTGDITEENMERLIEALLLEEGQSAEDYRRRADMFAKIAEFFREGRSYSTVEQRESWTGPEFSRMMQVLVDIVLAEDSRSANDYNCRAQLFSKSAEVFPFNAGT